MRLRLIDGKESHLPDGPHNVGAQVRETSELKQIDEEPFE